MADSTLPQPKYTIWQSISAAINLSLRAIEEVRALASRPPVPGPAGKDGLGFDKLSMEYDGERTFTFVFRNGSDEIRHPFKVAGLPLDKGIWRQGKYEKSDTVTFSGRAFIANVDTEEKPDIGAKDWRLMANRGRDGKDGVVRGPQGPVKLG